MSDRMRGGLKENGIPVLIKMAHRVIEWMECDDFRSP